MQTSSDIENELLRKKIEDIIQRINNYRGPIADLDNLKKELATAIQQYTRTAFAQSNLSHIQVSQIWAMINHLEKQNLRIACIALYKKIIDFYEQNNNHIKHFNAALKLFDCCAKSLPEPNNPNPDSLRNCNIDEIFDLLLCMNYCVAHADSSYRYLEKRDQAQGKIKVKINFLAAQIIRLQGYIFLHFEQPLRPENLSIFEKYYLKINALHILQHNQKSVLINLLMLANQYYLSLRDNDSLKTASNIQKMYDYARQVINMAGRDDHFTHLRITEIFEMYARSRIEQSPELSITIYSEALSYKDTHCKDLSAIFFCLKGLAACHLKLTTPIQDNITHINDHIRIIKNLRAAITLLNDAIIFHRQHLNHLNIPISDCYHLLYTCHYELGLQYEVLYKNHVENIHRQSIADEYQQACDWAEKCNDPRLVGKTYAQLASYYYLNDNVRDAISCWEKAIRHLLADLKQKYRHHDKYLRFVERFRAIDPRMINNNADLCSQYTNLIKDITNFVRSLSATGSIIRYPRNRHLWTTHFSAIPAAADVKLIDYNSADEKDAALTSRLPSRIERKY